MHADDETERFVKKCHVYRKGSDSRDFGNWLNKEKHNLLKHGVPIKLVLSKCDSLRFRIALPGGRFTYIETDYPKIEDPDSKGNQYQWEPEGPSDDYWLFRFYGWEWAGWRLVHKRTGQFVETVNECQDAPITVGVGFIATICSGNYENESPTLYIADTRSTKIRWSGGLVLGDCQEHDMFQLEEMQFRDATHLSVLGYCSSSSFASPNIASRTTKTISQIFTISVDGVSTIQGRSDLSTEWK